MSSFEVEKRDGDGRARLGTLHTPHGKINTPAFFPVLDFIGGTTPRSGGIWSRIRNRLFGSPKFNGALYQAMSFLNFGITPENLEDWRKKTLHEHFTDHQPPKPWHPTPNSFTEPLFVDSGGYRLMQSDTFQVSSGGELDNEWGLGTKPESILDLQYDYGADVIATLDFPIPQDLKQEEKEERMKRSIDSALEAIELLETETKYEDWSPSVYVAIHGHSFDEINWYVGEVLQQLSDESLIDGFAIGSLVPLRSNIDTLVDIVQGAVDAIPDEKRDEYGLHVFGISGKLFGLLSLLGVDSFDSTTYVQTARNRDFVHPETWKRISYNEITKETWECDCVACQELNPDLMKQVLEDGDSVDTNYIKSDFYAIMAHHNFLLYEKEVEEVREAIRNESLLEHVVELSIENHDVRKGMKRAQMRDAELREPVKEFASDYDFELLPPHEQLVESTSEDSERTISLKYSSSDYNVLEMDYDPRNAPVLLILPCSQTKPYGKSKSHRTVAEALQDIEPESYTKLTVSGLYGPVPKEHETLDPVMQYDYVLNSIDNDQRELVISRLTEYLDEHGDKYEKIIGYAGSKHYRNVIAEAFENTNRGTLLPSNPNRRHLWEQNRKENLQELKNEIKSLSESKTISDAE